MTKDQFWQMIQRSLDQSGGDIDEQANALKAELLKLPPEEIVSFDEYGSMLARSAFRVTYGEPLTSSRADAPMMDLNTSGAG